MELSGNLFCFALLCFFLKELEESKRHKSGQVDSICCRDGVIFKPSSKVVHSPIIERTTKHGTSKPSHAHAAAERRSRTLLLRPITWNKLNTTPAVLSINIVTHEVSKKEVVFQFFPTQRFLRDT